MNHTEKMVGTRCILALIAGVTSSLFTPQVATAQVSPQGNQAHGMFGDRTLGQSFVPRPSTFGGGIQTGPSGNFLSAGRTNGSAAFATPWRQSDAGGGGQPVGAAPAVQAAVSTQAPAPANTLPAAQTLVESVPPSFLETNGWDGTSPADQGLGLPSGIAPSAAWNVTVGGVGPPAAASAASPQLYIRSPQLSNRLTEIARSKHMVFGQGVDVYLGNNVAVLQGAVHTTADSALLASVLALEPDVRHIDNRLFIGGAGPR